MVYKFRLKNADAHFLIDDQTYEYIAKNALLSEWDAVHNFRVHENGYPVFHKLKTVIYLHRFVIQSVLGEDLKRNQFVIPKNGNKLDCRASNLVVVSSSAFRNAVGLKKNQNAGYYKENGRYRTRMSVNGKQVTVGYYDTEEEAREAYIKAKSELLGEQMPTKVSIR